MVVAAVIRKSRPSRTQGLAEVSRVAALLRDEPPAGFTMLARLAAVLGERMPEPEARLNALDGLRPALWAAMGPTLRPLRGQPIPLSYDEVAAFHRVAIALRGLRDAFKRIHADLAGASGRPSPRALLALSRALDAQSSLIATACRLRIALPREDWDELCRLAHPLVAASSLDAPFADTTGGRGPASAGSPRAALVMPLLLRLLEPLGLRGAALDTAGALARVWAPRIGVRIELDGLPHVGADGPAMMLSIDHTVVLDTRAAIEGLARFAEKLKEGVSPGELGVRSLLPAAPFADLLSRLLEVWGPNYVPRPLVRPPVSQATMLLGLPRRVRRGSTALPDEPVAPSVPTAHPYIYGRGASLFGIPAPAPVAAPSWREAMALAPAMAEAEPEPEPPPPQVAEVHRDAIEAAIDGLADLDGQPVAWRGRDSRRSVFARSVDGPRLHLGQLVSVLPRRPRARPGAPRPGAGPSRLMLGRISTLAHTGSADGREPAGHDIGVAFWPGSPIPVRARIEGSTAFEDAWWFESAAGGEPPCLVLRRERFETPVDVSVRHPGGDVTLRMARLLERGLDFDRVALEPPG